MTVPSKWTKRDARDRVDLARIGSLQSGATVEYLAALSAELRDWLSSVEATLDSAQEADARRADKEFENERHLSEALDLERAEMIERSYRD